MEMEMTCELARCYFFEGFGYIRISADGEVTTCFENGSCTSEEFQSFVSALAAAVAYDGQKFLWTKEPIVMGPATPCHTNVKPVPYLA